MHGTDRRQRPQTPVSVLQRLGVNEPNRFRCNTDTIITFGFVTRCVRDKCSREMNAAAASRPRLADADYFTGMQLRIGR